MSNQSDFIAELQQIVGAKYVLTGENDMSAFILDGRGRYQGKALVVVRPKSAGEVSDVVKACAKYDVSIVPQGGNTGLVLGSIPDKTGSELVLSLLRMNKIRELDSANSSMVAEAGCVLQTVQRAAQDADFLFPLSLAAEGSCTIGGNLSTNAGGTAVLKYGNARELVLGLEVVLADGEIWHGLRRLRKDNRGYKLMDLFLGSEGSLGIITAAVLKLYPLPKARVTALLAISNPEAAIEILAKLRNVSGDRVSAFEYINRASLEMALFYQQAHSTAGENGKHDPFENIHQHYLLLEVETGVDVNATRQAIEEVFAQGFDEQLINDGIVAESESQRTKLWTLRETIPLGTKLHGAGLKHDIAVPVSNITALLAQAEQLSLSVIDNVKVIAFGHLGDGNIHFNLSKPDEMDEEKFLSFGAEIKKAIYALVYELDGTFSAEHGIGRAKKKELLLYKDETEIKLMQKLKQALDPDNRLNPNVIL